jgi:hypothetical protein
MYILRITAIWFRTLPYYFVVEIPGTFYCNKLLLFQEILSIPLSTQDYSCNVIEIGHSLLSAYTTLSRPLRLSWSGSIIHWTITAYSIIFPWNVKLSNQNRRCIFVERTRSHFHGHSVLIVMTFTRTHYPLKCHLMLWSMKSINLKKKNSFYVKVDLAYLLQDQSVNCI